MTRDTLERLARRELSPGELIDALRHVDGCPECAVRAAQLARVDDESLRAIAASAPAEHLDFDSQLLPFVERRLGRADLEIVESHLEDCAMCRAEVDDLRELHETTTRPPQARWGMLAAAAAAMIVALLAVIAVRDPPLQRSTPRAISVTRPQLPAPGPPAASAPRYSNAEWERLAASAIASHTLPFPSDLAELAPPPEQLRGASAASAESGMHPAGVVVRELRPSFSWPAREHATYVVSIYSGDDEVAKSGTLRDPRWTPRRDLRRGVTYVWQVNVTSGETTDTIPAPPAPPAMFRISSESDEEAIRNATAAHPDDHFLHAVLLARAGLREEAADALALARSAGDDRAANIK